VNPYARYTLSISFQTEPESQKRRKRKESMIKKTPAIEKLNTAFYPSLILQAISRRKRAPNELQIRPCPIPACEDPDAS